MSSREDYALRFTATKARKWSSFRVANTAIGAISFLACEAIGGSLTLSYGSLNTTAAILAVSLLIFLLGVPVTYYATKFGVDIDLLTRGAGFGYIGSTVTSLVYASFTFILFSIEATIMSLALTMCLGIPLALAHVISALVVIPIAAYGIRFISRLQLWTQPLWLVLQFTPIVYIAVKGAPAVSAWASFPGLTASGTGVFNFLSFGAAASILLSLAPQIGEQVDYLRFLPPRPRVRRWRWWAALLIAGPGWVVIGGGKLLAGSFLAVLAIHFGVPPERAAQPTELYRVAFVQLLHSPTLGIVLTGLFVVTCQLKINVTNAYAGSIAWSNFFSRLTHSHPGRVVWLTFNVLLALLLMEVGIFRAIDSILGLYSNFAIAWIGAVTADLVINKPLGLSPPYIEFKRAHLYDINPVGVFAMLISVTLSSAAFLGAFGMTAKALAPFIGLAVAFAAAPVIAFLTKGKYYIARISDPFPATATDITCTVCEGRFEPPDMAFCPAYSGPICSLCCSLDARCHDRCKEGSRFVDQITAFVKTILPRRFGAGIPSRVGHFIGVQFLLVMVIGGLMTTVYYRYGAEPQSARLAVRAVLWIVFFSLMIVSGVFTWILVLAQENRRTVEQEFNHQTVILMSEIEAHERTDAALQKAKEVAEAANVAKSRYIVGVSHEIRAPLNAISGYAQLLERGAAVRAPDAGRVISRSAEHLTNLVDGLLDISRIESGSLRLNRDRVDIRDFLLHLVDMFRLHAEAKNISFAYDPPPFLPDAVMVDEKRLRQILINLLSNAIKYTERGGSVAFQANYRNQIAEFIVSDSGIGIPPESLAKIFEPFERGRMPAVQLVPGTGLGLTIAKLLTEVMGGEIAVESTLGVGSTFRVRLFLFEAGGGRRNVSARDRIVGYAGPRKMILVADDDSSQLDIVRATLEPLGFSVIGVSDGTACLRAAEAARPDLVLLDISMPGMSGWAVAEALRRQERAPLRIIMVSASVHEFVAPRAEAAHDDYLTKPIDLGSLLDHVGTQLALTWVYRPDQPSPARKTRGADVPQAVRHRLDELLRLGRVGYVRGIEEKLDEIEQDDPRAGAFVDELRALVQNFELKRYMTTLQAAQNYGE